MSELLADRRLDLQKKLINEPKDVVIESLEGLALSYPRLLYLHEHPLFLQRRDAPVPGKVALVSGSGSGHDPLNSGYVGVGMLDAACPGDIFTSPTPDQYLAAMRAVYAGAGALFVMKNFAGSVLNMGLAIEMAEEEGYTIESVLVSDDVALDNRANRRGLGATVLVEKMAGAAAEAGWPLPEVARVARQTASRAASMGAALTSCTTPAFGQPTFSLPKDEIELGVGMHGERGRYRIPLTGADELTKLLVEPIVRELALQGGDRVLALISGLGATPQQELYIVYRRLHQLLSDLDVTIERRLVGNYITSLDMAGCSLTLLRLTPELLSLWDAPVHTAALWW